MRLLAAAVLASAALAAGCAAERETVTVTVSETAADELAQRCEHEEDGYGISYPVSWHSELCEFFHPDDFEVPARSELLGVAIVISLEPVSFAAVTSGEPDRGGGTREELEVAGRPAVRLEYESGAGGLLPEGTPVYEVLVDLGAGTLIATTRGLDGLDFEANARVLDRMLETLELDGA